MLKQEYTRTKVEIVHREPHFLMYGRAQPCIKAES
jgi:hypothetical protein